MDPKVDDILEELNNSKAKKKIKSGSKGKGAERELVKLLNTRFEVLLQEHEDWGKFSRSVGSGNRWGQKVDLPKHAKDTFSGDLCVPQNFLWVIESKKGYNNEIDLCSIFGSSCAVLESFFKQVNDDSKRCERKPLLIWKKDYKPRIAFLKDKDMPIKKFTCVLKYQGWTAMPFDELLEMEDSFFFNLNG